MAEREKQVFTETLKKGERKRSSRNPAHVLASHVVEAMLEKKGHDVVVMDMRNVSGVADFFVLCTGDSDLQIKAIAESIRERIREQADEKPWHTEGGDHWQWVLLDYVDVVAHIFNAEKRTFYNLERLWGDAPNEQVPDNGSASDVEILRDAAQGGKKGGARTAAR